MLDLVPYISSHQGISLEELAEAFTSSQAHITEDLNTLWMCGLPGYTPLELMELSFESGFVTIRNAQTLQKPRSMSRDEILALILGLEYLRDQVPQANESLTLQMGSLLSRLSALAGAPVHERVATSMPALASIRSHIAEAIEHRGKIGIDYHSLVRDVVTTRVILPLNIYIENDVEYVLAFCNLARAHRTFRLDRILSATVETADDPSAISGTQPIDSGKVEIGLEISDRKRDVLESFGLDAKDQSSIASVEVFNTDWATRTVMSMGGAVRITSPRNCVESISARAAKALIGYGLSAH